MALDVRRVSEEYLAQVRGRVRGVDGSAEALLDQSGQAATVVDVSVRKQNQIYRGGVERKLPVAPLALGPAPLVEAAIEQNALPGHLEQMLGTRDIARSTVGSELHVFPLLAVLAVDWPIALR